MGLFGIEVLCYAALSDMFVTSVMFVLWLALHADDAQLTDNGYLDTVVHDVRGMCEGIQLRDYPSFLRTMDRGDIILNFRMTNEQLLEFAWGLANSGYAFIWNIRPDLVKGDTAVLPPEFLTSIKDFTMLTTLCFLTHSWWNSTLESICGGVAMLNWPFFAEQQTNCRFKRTKWGNMMEIDGEVKRAELAAMLPEVMEGGNGWEKRRCAAEWKENALRETLPVGPRWSTWTRWFVTCSLPSPTLMTVDIKFILL